MPCQHSVEEDGPASHKERRKALQEVASGLAVGYTVVIKKIEEQVPDQPIEALPPSIQAVIDKHSGPGGTLCGKIPDHTHAREYQCHIELHEGANPVHIRQYRLTPREKEELEEKVESFIKKGWIEPSNSSWSSSVLFVPKPNNKLRFCVDFRALNARTVLDRGPIPHQSELLDSLQGAQIFSALDLASGYYQLELDEKSRAYTAFPTPYGLYQWKVMPMGLTNAPAIFQRAMNEVLHEHIRNKYCRVYLDDIIILSKDEEEHAKHLDAVLQDLTRYHLFCQLPKCVWAKKELTYLGHLVNGQGIKPDPSKVAALQHWKPPLEAARQLDLEETSLLARSSLRKQIQHECRRFLGFMNYFNRFIPRYSAMAAPLTDQTKDEAPVWTDECTQAWNTMKTLLANATMMYHPDFRYPFHVFTDASIRAVGGVLIQIIDGKVHPVAFTARKLIPAEVNYTTTEQEMLAVVYCFSQWRCYLEGTDVVLHTDHEPLTWLQTQKTLNRRQARWLEFLSRFQYEVVYVKGDENVVADALTRTLRVHDGECERLPSESWPDVALTIAESCRVPHNSGISPAAAGSSGAGHGETAARDSAGRCNRLTESGVGPTRGGTPGSPGQRCSRSTADRDIRTGTDGPSSILTFVAASGYTRARAVRAVDSRNPGAGCSRGETDASNSDAAGGLKPVDAGIRADAGRRPAGAAAAEADANRTVSRGEEPTANRSVDARSVYKGTSSSNKPLRSILKRVHPSANREADMPSTCNLERPGGTSRKIRRVRWDEKVGMESAEGTRYRDADTPPTRCGVRINQTTPRGSGRVNHDNSVPDQPVASDSLEGPDQSLSTYVDLSLTT